MKNRINLEIWNFTNQRKVHENFDKQTIMISSQLNIFYKRHIRVWVGEKFSEY